MTRQDVLKALTQSAQSLLRSSACSLGLCLCCVSSNQAFAKPAQAKRKTKKVRATTVQSAKAKSPKRNRPQIKRRKPTQTKPSKREVTLRERLVEGQRTRKNESHSTFRIRLEQLSIIPFKDITETMMMAPSLLVTNHGGDGHAPEIFLRGFSAGEGQDLEFLVQGIPLNEVSNPHGHGYIDPYFIPPEFVQSFTLTEGAFDAAQGNFAVAGTADYRL
ncbi:MAG: Plug domain-containing protein, partial [Myxococcota bacterium]